MNSNCIENTQKFSVKKSIINDSNIIKSASINFPHQQLIKAFTIERIPNQDAAMHHARLFVTPWYWLPLAASPLPPILSKKIFFILFSSPENDKWTNYVLKLRNNKHRRRRGKVTLQAVWMSWKIGNKSSIYLEYKRPRSSLSKVHSMFNKQASSWSEGKWLRSLNPCVLLFMC